MEPSPDPDELLDRIEAAGRQHAHLLAVQKSKADRRERVGNLHESFRWLLKRHGELDERSLIALGSRGFDIEAISEFHALVRALRSELSKAGRPVDEARDQFINDVADVYKTACGKPASIQREDYSKADNGDLGPFDRLLKPCARPLSIRTTAATIRRVLKKRQSKF